MPTATVRPKAMSQTIWQPFFVLVSREASQLRKGLWKFVAKVGIITLSTVFVFDFVLPQLSGGGVGGVGADYAAVLGPGMIAVTTCNQSMTAAMTALSLDFGPVRRIDQALLAPIPEWLLALVRIIGGAMHGVLAAGIVLPIVMFVRPPGSSEAVDLARWPYLALTVLVASFLFASLGVVLGASSKAALSSTMLVYFVPVMIMLGCVYYPWAALGAIRWLQVIVLFNPVVYVTEATRFATAPQLGHMPEEAFGWVLGVGLVVTLAAGMARYRAAARR